MKRLLKTSVLVLTLGTAALAMSAPGPFSTADAGRVESYALRLPVVVAADASLQRLALPAQALVGLQTPGYSDLRLFNAQGQAVPMALTAATAKSAAERQQLTLPAYPILGPAGAAGRDGLSLRIEEQAGRRVVQLDTGNPQQATPPASQQVLGALLDARAIGTPVVALMIDVDLPNAQPVAFTVQASKDLKNWRPLGATVLYRAAAAQGDSGAASAWGTQSLKLAFEHIKDHYLRITWADTAGQPVSLTVRGATLTTSKSTPGNGWVEAGIKLPALTNPHEMDFSLPFATPVAALKITPQGMNVLIPVRVLGRNDRSQPWVLLANTVVYRLQAAGQEQISGPVELPAASYRNIKIEADKKTPGFAVEPKIVLQFEPVEIAFLASGPAPFTLAVGLENASSAYLPVQSLIPGYQPAQEKTLPMARLETVDAPGTSATTLLLPVKGAADGLPTRSWVLWGVLLVGALALALMALALLRQAQKPVAEASAEPS